MLRQDLWISLTLSSLLLTMGASFSSNQLSAAVSNGIPTASYAYSPANTKLFGVDAAYIYTSASFANVPTPVGQITPYLINAASPTLICSPFAVSQSGTPQAQQSLQCPVTGASLASGLYTVSFSQFTSTVSVDQNGFTRFVRQTGVNTLTNFGAAVTFSIVPPQPASTTTTVTPTPTVSTTITSGISRLSPTNTVIVPSSTQTVTVYQTTIISTSVAFSTLRGASAVTVTGSCPKATLLKCNQDNCLRAFLGRTASASAFCSLYTESKVTATPTYATQCGGLTSRVSSACTCLGRPTAKRRGIIVATYAAPDFTYSVAIDTVIVTSTIGPLTTVVSGPVPSSTR